MDPWVRNAARRAKGFMPDDEGMTLFEAATAAATVGPLLEIGSYCGKSTLYLAAAARDAGTVVYSVDHHRGSEEHQIGQEYFDAGLLDASGRVDSLPEFRKTITEAGVDDVVIGVVAPSTLVGKHWTTPLGMVFIDGGHSSAAANDDYETWAPHVTTGGLLAIHDVFPDPEEGGRPPFEIYERALASDAFEEIGSRGSLRVLQRVGNGV